MNFNELYQFLTSRIPREESYHPEPYGASNCENVKTVNKILYCVTPSPEIDDYFFANNYDLMINHHIGYSEAPHITFHTALDFCRGGLTDYWNQLVGVIDPKPIIKNAGIYGKIKPLPFEELVAKIDTEVGGIIGQIQSNKKIVESVAICSGLGAIIEKEVVDLNVDCYILGQTWHPFETSGLNGIIEIGHTKSETIGYKCIATMLREINSSIIIEPAPLELDCYGREVHFGMNK